MGALRWRIAGGFMAALVLAVAGCTSKDAEHLARVGEKVADKSKTLTADPTSKLSAGIQSVRANLTEWSLESRVLARIKWDKSLADAAIDVRVSDNHVHLTGVIRSESQRRRAIELAKTTAGVEKVTEELTIAEPSR